MLRIIRIPLIAALLIFSASCGASKAQGNLVFNGPINNENVTKAIKFLNENPETDSIIITSAGGDARDGIRLGRILNAKNVKVIVRSYCNSACAQYVFFPAKQKFIEKHSLVLFHNSMTLLMNLYEHNNELRVKGVFGSVSRDEIDFLESIGADLDFLRLGYMGLKPICVFRIDPSAQQIDASSFRAAYEYASFGVDRKTIERMSRTKIYGYWPVNNDEMKKVLSILPFNANFRVNWLDLTDSRRSNSQLDPGVVGYCHSS